MLVYARSKNRPYHLGPFPLETLARDDAIIEAEARRPKIAGAGESEPNGLLAGSARRTPMIRSAARSISRAPAIS